VKLRDSSARKACPPHKWQPVSQIDCPPRPTEAVYHVRLCTECKCRQHAVIYPTVWEGLPLSMFHLADASWTTV
jgi:hypothetical protein